MAMSFGGVSKAKVATIIVAADGTGDTTDIQTGINLLPATGGAVYIKEGTYTTASKITINVSGTSIQGSGFSTFIQTNGFDDDIIEVVSISNILIRNLRLTGSGIGKTSNRGLVIGLSTNITIENVYVRECGAHGIFISLSDKFWLTESTISVNYYHGIYCRSSSIGFLDNNYVYANDFANSATYDGIHLETCDDCTISNNRCQDNDRYEINVSDVGSDRNIVIGNKCYGTDHVGTINDAGTNTIVEHNSG